MSRSEVNVLDVERVVWMLHAQFEAQTLIISERMDESDDNALAARNLARTGRDLAEMLGLYLGGSAVTFPGSSQAKAEGAS